MRNPKITMDTKTLSDAIMSRSGKLTREYTALVVSIVNRLALRKVDKSGIADELFKFNKKLYKVLDSGLDTEKLGFGDTFVKKQSEEEAQEIIDAFSGGFFKDQVTTTGAVKELVKEWMRKKMKKNPQVHVAGPVLQRTKGGYRFVGSVPKELYMQKKGYGPVPLVFPTKEAAMMVADNFGINYEVENPMRNPIPTLSDKSEILKAIDDAAMRYFESGTFDHVANSARVNYGYHKFFENVYNVARNTIPKERRKRLFGEAFNLLVRRFNKIGSKLKLNPTRTESAFLREEEWRKVNDPRLKSLPVYLHKNYDGTEYRANIEGGNEDTAYYSDDKEDAVGTVLHMLKFARERGDKRLKENPFDIATYKQAERIYDMFMLAAFGRGVQLGSKLGKKNLSHTQLENESAREVAQVLRNGKSDLSKLNDALIKLGHDYVINEVPINMDSSFCRGYNKASGNHDRRIDPETIQPMTLEDLLQGSKRNPHKSNPEPNAASHHTGTIVKQPNESMSQAMGRAQMSANATGAVINLYERKWGKGQNERIFVDTFYPAHKNPSEPNAFASAERITSMFHGREPKETVEIEESVFVHDNLAELGKLVSIDVTTVNKDKAELTFSPESKNPVLLCADPEGTTLHLEGGDQSLNLKQLGFAPTQADKDKVVIGTITEITYRTQKNFDNFQDIDYFHALGEEDLKRGNRSLGVRPMLIYDKHNRRMEIAGGNYQIKDVGIVN